MPRKKALTPAEVREKKAGFKEALKKISEALKPHTEAKKEAHKALTDARNEAKKNVMAAEKTFAVMTAKFDKANAAATQGKTKIEGQLAALDGKPAGSGSGSGSGSQEVL